MKLLLLFVLLIPACCFAQTLSGFMREKGSNKQVSGVSVQCLETKKGSNSNKYGFYSVSLLDANDSLTFVFSSMGYDSEEKRATHWLVVLHMVEGYEPI